MPNTTTDELLAHLAAYRTELAYRVQTRTGDPAEVHAEVARLEDAVAERAAHLRDGETATSAAGVDATAAQLGAEADRLEAAVATRTPSPKAERAARSGGAPASERAVTKG